MRGEVQHKYQAGFKPVVYTPNDTSEVTSTPQMMIDFIAVTWSETEKLTNNSMIK